MRHWFVALTLLAGCFGSEDDLTNVDSEERGMRFITVGADALGTAQEALAMRVPNARVTPVAVANDVAILEYDARDFWRLSSLMHEQHSRCAGFIQHASLADAMAALAPAPQPLAITYTIDNTLAVNAMLADLRQSGIAGTITDLSSFKNRYYASTFGAAASDWIRDKWTSLAGGRSDITVSQVAHSGFGQKSVILSITGTTLPNEIVVLGGHMDSIASGGSNSTAPGADDDGSGIATLTEVIRAIVQRGFRPQRTVHFMAYAAEEIGLVGSDAIAASYKSQNKNVVGVLQLDMTQYHGSNKDIWFMTDFTNAAQNTFLKQLIDRYTGATWGDDACGYACSDHASWHQRGYAASMPFEARLGEDNPNIHTSQDTLAFTQGIADNSVKFGRMAVAFVAEVAKGSVDTSKEILREDFETGSWTTTGLWHRATSSACGPGPGFSSATHSLYFGQDGTCNFSTGARVSGTATSPSITSITSASALRFRYLRQVQSTMVSKNDVAKVSVKVGATKTVVWNKSSLTASQARWLQSDSISLSQFAGQTIQLVFEFDSITQNNNQFTGWMIDDVVVTH